MIMFAAGQPAAAEPLDEAEVVLAESLELRRAALPAGHPLVGHSLNNLAMTLQARGALVEAELRFREALAILEPALGEHPDVASTANNLASCLHGIGRIDGAEATYRRALEMRRRILPPGHPHVAHNLLGLGRLLVSEGRAAEAEPMLREALEIREVTMPTAAAQIAEARDALDSCRRALGRGNPG